MDVICAGWGGCANLIKHCLQSDLQLSRILKYYDSINIDQTWTDQEWKIRDNADYQICHESVNNSINLAWNNSLDTTFNYLIKNIELNHLSGSIQHRVNCVIKFNIELEQKLRLNNKCWNINSLIGGNLFNECREINSNLSKSAVDSILSMWKSKTLLFYQLNSDKAVTLINQFYTYNPNNFKCLLD